MYATIVLSTIGLALVVAAVAVAFIAVRHALEMWDIF